MYQYKPLIQARSIRVIRLSPSVNSNPLIIKLQEVPLVHSSRFEALSYAWARPFQGRSILCDGEDLLVSATVEEALKRLRYKTQSRTLWIDQICINQDSEEERSQQVALMGDVYTMAARVIVWLGSNPATDKLLKYVRLYQLSNLVPFGIFGVVDKTRIKLERKLEPALCLPDLTPIPWFDRMWTVQEVAMAHSVQIVTPTRSYNYDTFMAYLSDWLDRRAHVNPKEYPSASITLSRGWGFPEVLVTMGGDSATDLFTARKELRFWVNWIRAGEPKIEQQQTMDNYLIGYRFTQTEAFCNITAASSSDPKDKVFSVQSLMDTIGVHFPPPDYSLDIGEIYWRACLSILRHDNYLALLRLVNGPHPSKWKSKVPSWVPDFDRTCRRWQMNFKYLRSANTYSCPCLKFTPDERILITNAKIIDKIGGMIYEEVVKVLDYSPTSEFMERYNKSIKAVQRLIIAALSVRPSTVGQMGEKRIDPLTMILFQITPVLIKMNGCGPDHFEQNDFVKLLRLSIYEPEKISQMYKTTVTASKVQNDLLANTDFQASSHLPEFQMLPIILTHGWLKHLNKISNVAVGNALIWTKDSLCGTGPTSVQPGDVVALIPTIKAPMILRPTPRGTFEVIGPAFITGLMNGEKWSEDIDPDNYNGHDLPEIQLE